MNLVFEFATKDKQKVIAILEADPYGKPSFSRNGYKVKDGAQSGQDREKTYAFMRATDEFATFAREKLKDVAAESKPEVVSAITKIIEEEESNSEVGFGSIFG
jgi:hypothetical protein